jgi:hypothetical protein
MKCDLLLLLPLLFSLCSFFSTHRPTASTDERPRERGERRRDERTTRDKENEMREVGEDKRRHELK